MQVYLVGVVVLTLVKQILYSTSALHYYNFIKYEFLNVSRCRHNWDIYIITYSFIILLELFMILISLTVIGVRKFEPSRNNEFVSGSFVTPTITLDIFH